MNRFVKSGKRTKVSKPNIRNPKHPTAKYRTLCLFEDSNSRSRKTIGVSLKLAAKMTRSTNGTNLSIRKHTNAKNKRVVSKLDTFPA